MVSKKLMALAAVVLIVEISGVRAQCNGRVEFISQPNAMPTITTTSYVQPVNQFVIPAIIKPIIQSEPYMTVMPPSVPDYSSFFNPIGPSSAMPPIIFDSGSNGDSFDNLLYFILFALRNRRNGGLGRSGSGNSNDGCSCGRCGNNCGGCCNSCGGCGNRSCGCGNFNSCSNCGRCLNCGNSSNGGGCSKCGGCECGSGNGHNGNISCPCGGNCIYIPFPIAVPIGNGIQFGCNGGCPVIETSFGGCDDNQSSCGNSPSPNEINLIIRTDQ